MFLLVRKSLCSCVSKRAGGSVGTGDFVRHQDDVNNKGHLVLLYFLLSHKARITYTKKNNDDRIWNFARKRPRPRSISLKLPLYLFLFVSLFVALSDVLLFLVSGDWELYRAETCNKQAEISTTNIGILKGSVFY